MTNLLPICLKRVALCEKNNVLLASYFCNLVNSFGADKSELDRNRRNSFEIEQFFLLKTSSYLVTLIRLIFLKKVSGFLLNIVEVILKHSHLVFA